MDANFDTGPIIDKRIVDILFQDTWLDLRTRINNETGGLISDNLDSIKIKIQEIETELLSDLYKNQERQFYEVNRRTQFEAIRYTIYSLIFIIFYLKLALFFNRLQKSS